jgi:hypothetical protein
MVDQNRGARQEVFILVHNFPYLRLPQVRILWMIKTWLLRSWMNQTTGQPDGCLDSRCIGGKVAASLAASWATPDYVSSRIL